MDYYASHTRTVANSIELAVYPKEQPHFPNEGLCIGALQLPDTSFPALIDLFASKGTCFLYDSTKTRNEVNLCLERIAWRLALCLPSEQIEFLVYNGGNPGENFNSLNHIHKSLIMSSRTVLFDADSEEFTKHLSSIYRNLATRVGTIRNAGKSNLYELNESEGFDAKIKYTFILISDFPHVSEEQKKLLSKIVTADCSRSGVFVFMSWDMSAPMETKFGESLDYKGMLDSMLLLFPKNDRFYFKNSENDALINKFVLKLDSDIIGNISQEEWAKSLNTRIEDTIKQNERVVLKQDFAKAEAMSYEPVMSEISVTVGLDIEDKHEVTLRFNSRDYIHAFILGQSGSGKSVLLNNIITTAILKYSPDDLMLYLLDFKGVEFNRYRGVKHTKAVLVDNSDSQMTLEVLRELKEENARRIKLWRNEGVNNIDGYNRKYPDARLPQVLFVADECQVMFQPAKNGSQRIIQNEISEILNTIATQGRSQGIHMLLATQQLDETDISGQVLKNLTECFLLMSAPSDSNRLVPDSSVITSKQPTGLACYYHKKELQSRVQTFFAKDEELESAIIQSQKKAANYEGNGSFYFSGSSVFSLGKENLKEYENISIPVALIGKNIGLSGETTEILLRNDYFENILFFGVNKQGQTTTVLLSALVSLMYSYQKMGEPCDFLVIDCLQDMKSPYKKQLETWCNKGLCHIIERSKSGRIFADIAKDISNDCARPVVLAIIGSERFIEMKRNLPLEKGSNEKTIISEETSNDNTDLIEPMTFDLDLPDLESGNNISNTKMPKTFQKALNYILEEGPMQGVHVLLQVDKPGNILFEGDYGLNATDKFRHKVILKSENKFLQPMRFSQDIDVESLSDEEEHLRAYYYPEGDNPQLFTPFSTVDIDDEIFNK